MTMQHVDIKSSQPVVFAKNGAVFASSRDVAEFFEKEHRNVMQSIDRLIEQEPSLTPAQFSAGVYVIPETGRQQHRYFEMTRDGFTLLAMGFTGAKALQWKLRYIEAFNKMESQLKSAPATINVRDPSQLATIAIQLIEVNKELEQRAVTAEAHVEAVKPKVRAFDQFMNAEGLYGLQNAARVLGLPPNKFISYLKQKYLFYQGGALVAKRIYCERGLFEVKGTLVDDKARYQTFITPKGIEYFAAKLRTTGDLFGAN